MNALNGAGDRGLSWICIEEKLNGGLLVVIRHSGDLVQLGSDGKIEGDELDDEALEGREVS